MRSLRRLRERGTDWTPATLPRVSQKTWDTLVTLGYVQERRGGGPPTSAFFVSLRRGGEPLSEVAIESHRTCALLSGEGAF